MKTYIEKTLVEMRQLSPLLSVDIYYNDLPCDGEFVVWVHDPFGTNEHFRSNHIRKSLKMALKWLKENHK